MDEERPPSLSNESADFIDRVLGNNVEKVQRERALLGLQTIKLALEELGHGDDNLPYIGFSGDLVVNGTPRAGGFVPKWEDAGGEEAIFMDLGNKPAEKCYGEELITYLKDNGVTDDVLNKMALVDTMFEEAYHLVDHKHGNLPDEVNGQGRTSGFEGSYYDQPHEKRAREFAEEMKSKYFALLSEKSPKLY